MTVYNAVYVALAEEPNVDCDLVTLDSRLARAPGPRCRIHVLRPTSACPLENRPSDNKRSAQRGSLPARPTPHFRRKTPENPQGHTGTAPLRNQQPPESKCIPPSRRHRSLWPRADRPDGLTAALSRSAFPLPLLDGALIERRSHNAAACVSGSALSQTRFSTAESAATTTTTPTDRDAPPPTTEPNVFRALWPGRIPGARRAVGRRVGSGSCAESRATAGGSPRLASGLISEEPFCVGFVFALGGGLAVCAGVGVGAAACVVVPSGSRHRCRRCRRGWCHGAGWPVRLTREAGSLVTFGSARSIA